MVMLVMVRLLLLFDTGGDVHGAYNFAPHVAGAPGCVGLGLFCSFTYSFIQYQGLCPITWPRSLLL